MARKSGSSFFLIQSIAMVATMGVTVAGFYLIGDGFEEQSSEYWISLASLLVAELVTFGYGILFGINRSAHSDQFPYQFTAIGIIAIYDFCVIVLCFIALAGVNSDWLGTLQLIVVVGLLIGLTTYHMGGQFVGEIARKEASQREPYLVLINESQALVNKSSMLEGESAEKIKQGLAEFREELEYCTAETLPGHNQSDRELLKRMAIVSGHVDSLANAASSTDEQQRIADLIEVELKSMNIEMKRRESAMIQART